MAIGADNPVRFWTRFLTYWCAIFAILHVFGLFIMFGTESHWWVYQNTRFTPAWVRWSEVPFFILEPGFIVNEFTSRSLDAYLSVKGTVTILAADSCVWLLPAFLVRAALWRFPRERKPL